ncbi:MAG: ubiquinone/menaquinone biosynthesis methyltransferase [Anaerolineae bacterium]|nr:ubiquinone/menaquinone biosynthesis methyltransferase [Anaerolineae bacterium]
MNRNLPPTRRVPAVADPRQSLELFAAIARRYDLMNHLMSAGLDILWRRQACALLDGGRPGPVLDLGTGTADLALTLARRRPELRIVGLDPSPQMLVLGQRKLAGRGLEGRIELLRGDALDLPLPDASCSAIVSAFVLRNLPDLPRALREMRRVVVPGGLVLCLELTWPQAPIFRGLFCLYFTRLVPVLGAAIANSRRAYTYLPASVAAFPRPEALARTMEEAGLTPLTARRLFPGTAAIHIGLRPEGP